MSDTATVTARLAQFIVESRWGDIPAGLRREAVRSILNHVGCALGSCRDEVTERALAVIGPFSGPREATVMGRAERMDVFGAAYLNAISSNVLDFDDTHVKTVIHPTAIVEPGAQLGAEGLAERGTLRGAAELRCRS